MPGEHKFFCLHGGSRSWEFGYREELERIAAEVPWFKYVATISRPWEDAPWKGQTGRVDDLVRMYIDEWNLRPESTTGYLCGHPSMCENGQGILTRAAGKEGPSSKRFISSLAKKQEPDRAAAIPAVICLHPSPYEFDVECRADGASLESWLNSEATENVTERVPEEVS